MKATRNARFEEMEYIVRRINNIECNISEGTVYTDDTMMAQAQWLLGELRADLAKLAR